MWISILFIHTDVLIFYRCIRTCIHTMRWLQDIYTYTAHIQSLPLIRHWGFQMLTVHMEDIINKRKHMVSGCFLLKTAWPLWNDIFDIPRTNLMGNNHWTQSHKILALSLTCYIALHKAVTLCGCDPANHFSVCLNDPVSSAVIQW